MELLTSGVGVNKRCLADYAFNLSPLTDLYKSDGFVFGFSLEPMPYWQYLLQCAKLVPMS
jgi:hypothetical protein